MLLGNASIRMRSRIGYLQPAIAPVDLIYWNPMIFKTETMIPVVE